MEAADNKWIVIRLADFCVCQRTHRYWTQRQRRADAWEGEGGGANHSNFNCQCPLIQPNINMRLSLMNQSGCMQTLLFINKIWSGSDNANRPKYFHCQQQVCCSEGGNFIRIWVSLTIYLCVCVCVLLCHFITTTTTTTHHAARVLHHRAPVNESEKSDTLYNKPLEEKERETKMHPTNCKHKSVWLSETEPQNQPMNTTNKWAEFMLRRANDDSSLCRSLPIGSSSKPLANVIGSCYRHHVFSCLFAKQTF